MSRRKVIGVHWEPAMLLTAIGVMGVLGVICYGVRQRRKVERTGAAATGGGGSVGLNGALIDPHR
jgi:cytochrome c oxidase assembly factor CtaG